MKKKSKQEELYELQTRQAELDQEYNQLVEKVETLKSDLISLVVAGKETGKVEDELSRLGHRIDAVRSGKKIVGDQVREKQEEIYQEERETVRVELEAVDQELKLRFETGLLYLAETVNNFDEFYRLFAESQKKANRYKLTMGTNKGLLSWYNVFRQGLTPFIRAIGKNRPDLIEGIDFSRFSELWTGDPITPAPIEIRNGTSETPIIFRENEFMPNTWHQVPNPLRNQNM